MTAYDIRDLTYEGQNVTLGGLNMSGLVWNPSGLFFYVVENDGSDKIYAYSVSTAWNAGTAAVTSDTFTLAATGTKGLELNADGTKVYYCRAQLLCERTLSPAYDISTAGAESTLNVASDLASTNPRGLRWGDSGDKLFFTDDNDQTVYVYDCSSAYDVTSGTFNAGDKIDVSARFPNSAGLSDLFFKPDGTELFLSSNFVERGTTPSIRQYDLTAWDLSTAVEPATTDTLLASVSSFIPFQGGSLYDWARGTEPDTRDPFSAASGGNLEMAPPLDDALHRLGVRYDFSDNQSISIGNGGAITADIMMNVGIWSNVPLLGRPYNVPLYHPRYIFGFGGESNVFPATGEENAPFQLKWLDTTDVIGASLGAQHKTDVLHVEGGPPGNLWDYGTEALWTVEVDDVSGDATLFIDGVIADTQAGVNLTAGPVFAPRQFVVAINLDPVTVGGAPEMKVNWSRITRVLRYSGTAFDPALEYAKTAMPLIGMDLSAQVGDANPITAMYMSSDGTKVYVVSTANDTLYQYSLGTIVKSCTGAGFNAYDSGGNVRLQVSAPGGAGHLEGGDVSVLVDGELYENVRVVGGRPNLPTGVAGAHIQMGYPFVCDIGTLDIQVEDGTLVGRKKRVAELLLKFYKSVMPLFGPDEDKLTQMKHPNKYDFSEPLALFSGDIRQPLDSDWNEGGAVLIRQNKPYPLTILAIAPDVPEKEDDQ